MGDITAPLREWFVSLYYFLETIMGIAQNLVKRRTKIRLDNIARLIGEFADVKVKFASIPTASCRRFFRRTLREYGNWTRFS